MVQRQRLSWGQTRAILEECRRREVRGGVKAILDVRKWAHLTIRLSKMSSYDTVMSIIRDYDKIVQKESSTHVHMKKDLFVTSVDIENAVIEWVWRMSNLNVFIFDDVIIEKARRIQTRLNEQLLIEKRTNLRFSKAWLFLFKQRNDFKMYRSHGESGDADEEAIREEVPLLHKMLSAFEAKDIFNADEFGLFYRQAPKTTIGTKRLPGKN